MYFTYLVKCIPTNQFYYGVCYKRGVSADRLWTTYFTSSKSVHRLIEDYGSDAFEVEIRRTFETSEAARLWESKVLKRMNVVKDPRWLNRTDLYSFAPRYGDDNHAKDPEVIAKMLRTNEVRAQEAGFESFASRISQMNPAKDPGVAKKIGEWKRGKIWITDPNTNRDMMILPEDLDHYLTKGFIKGRVKGRMIGVHTRRVYMNNGQVTKSVKPEQVKDMIAEGWGLGRKVSEKLQAHFLSMKK